MIRNILKQFILFLIQLIEYYQYKHKDLDENNELKKVIDILPVKNLSVETDYGYVPIEEINLTQPYTMYQLKLENGIKLNGAKNHIVYTDNHYQKFMGNLNIGENVLTKYGSSRVKKIKKTKNKVSMVDLSVGSQIPSYYTNDILSHNTVSASIVILHYILFNDDKGVMIVANKGSTVVEILDKIKSIYKLLPFFLKKGVIKWNEKSLTLENGCRIKTERRSKEPAVGFTVDLLYLDEFAKIPNNIVRPYYRSVVPTVVSVENSKIMITSTPDGYNLFYELLRDAERDEDDPDKNRYKPMRVYWWQIPGRRDTKMYFNRKKLEKYNLTIEYVISYLKDNFNYEMYEKIEDEKRVHYIKFDHDVEKTHINEIRKIRIDKVPLPEVAVVTNWKEEQTKLIGGEDAFKQEYDLQFIAGNKLLFSSTQLEKINNEKEEFESIELPNFDKKFHLPYTDLKFIKDKPDLFDIREAKNYHIMYGLDLGEGLGQDYSVINIFRLMPKTPENIKKNKHKFANIYDYFKVEQIGIFRNNIYSLNEVAHIFYLLAFEIFDPEKSKAVLEYNTYGGEFLSHMKNVFNQENEYSDAIFFRFKHRADDKIPKVGLKVKGGKDGKKLMVKDYQTTVKKGSIILHNETNIKEVFVFTKKETPSGDVTYQSETGNDDTIMSVINLASSFTLTQYKDFVDGFIQNNLDEKTRKEIEGYIEENEDDTSTPNLDVFTSGYGKMYKKNGLSNRPPMRKRPPVRRNPNNPFRNDSPFGNGSPFGNNSPFNR